MLKTFWAFPAKSFQWAPFHSIKLRQLAAKAVMRESWLIFELTYSDGGANHQGSVAALLWSHFLWEAPSIKCFL